jgi:glycosyltransferase involved in cell wall biosynthesis
MKNKSVLLAIATPGVIRTHTVQSLFQLFVNPPCQVSFFLQTGVYVDAQRNNAIKHALENKMDYILFIDNDMVFPADMLEKLIEHDKDVVSTNYVIKVTPAIPMAMDMNRNRVKMGSGLEKVYSAPTGTMLIKTSIFDKLSNTAFSRFKDEITGEQFGEDVAFCELCHREGIEIFIDHEMTKRIGHVGEKIYSFNDVGEEFR